MGVFYSGYRQSVIDAARNPVDRPPAGFIEAFIATHESTKQEDLSISESLNIGRKRIERREKIKELTGEDITALEGLAVPQMALSEIGRSARGQQAVTQYQTKLVELSSRFPEIKTDEELFAEIVEDSRRLREKTGKLMENSTFSGKLGSFAGAMAAVMQDPLVLGSMLFGVGASAGILRTALTEGGINLVSEAAVQPLVFQYKRKLGSPFTVGEAATRVAAAGAGGFLLAGTVKGVTRGVSSLVKPRVPGVDDLLESFEKGVKKPTELQRDAAAVVADYADVIRESPFDLADPVATQRHIGATAKAISDVESGNPVDVTDTLRGLEPREEVRGGAVRGDPEEVVRQVVTGHLFNPDVGLSAAEEVQFAASTRLLSPEQSARLVEFLESVKNIEDAQTLQLLSKEGLADFETQVDRIADAGIKFVFGEQPAIVSVPGRQIAARAGEPTEPLVPDFRLEEADEIAARANAILEEQDLEVPTGLLAETGGEPLPLMRSARELIAEAEDEVRVGFELKDCLIKG